MVRFGLKSIIGIMHIERLAGMQLKTVEKIHGNLSQISSKLPAGYWNFPDYMLEYV